MDNKRLKKLNRINKNRYIEETLKKRKYFSYRIDLVLIKIVLVCLFFMLIYSKSEDFKFALLITLQIFILLTLINSKILSNRAKKGKKVLFERIKRNNFEKKVQQMDLKKFTEYIKLILEKSGYKKIGNKNIKCINGYFNGNKANIKIFYMYSETNIDTRDIRNFIVDSLDEDYKYVVIATPYKLKNDTFEMIDVLKKEIFIDILDIDKLYDITNKLNILPDDEINYNMEIENSIKDNKNKIIKSNVFGSTKIIIYALSATFFYFTGKISYLNTYNKYISYYFIVLLILSIVYNLYFGTLFKKRKQ